MSERVGSDKQRPEIKWISESTHNRVEIDNAVIQIQSGFLSDPTLSDIDNKNKMAVLPLIGIFFQMHHFTKDLDTDSVPLI